MLLQPRLLAGIAVCAYGAAMFLGSLPHRGVTFDPILLVLIGAGLIVSAHGGRDGAAWRRGQFFVNLGAGERAKTIETRVERAEACAMLLAFAALFCWGYRVLGLGWIWLVLAMIGFALGSFREIAVATGLSKEPKKRAPPQLRIVN